MMKFLRLKFSTLIFFLFLSACAPPKDPIPLGVDQALPTESQLTQTPVPDALQAESFSDADSIPPTETPVPSPEEPTVTPRPTLTEWETVQQEVRRYRNRLDSSSDGYGGLTTALDQSSPNLDWCQGLSTAINDFVYIDDAEAEQALVELKEEQGCD